MNWLIRNLSSGEPQHVRDPYQGAPVSDLDERFDDLWQRVNKLGRVVGLRDRRYLNWRFRLHPVEQYHTFALTEAGRLCGYIMYRCSDETCYIEDVFCLEDDRCARSLLVQFLCSLRNEGSIATVVARMNQSFLRLPWLRAGFIGRPDYQGALLSNELKELVLSRVGGPAAWHLTGGDKDV